MTDEPDNFRSANVSVTIEQLRYWVPTIKDVARVVESDEDRGWTLSIHPDVPTACPVALTLKDSGRFDIVIAGETYRDRSLDKLDHIVPLLERIVDGGVVRRQWVSTTTGADQGVETAVRLGPGIVWRNGPAPDGSSLSRERHFLPYRRI